MNDYDTQSANDRKTYAAIKSYAVTTAVELKPDVK